MRVKNRATVTFRYALTLNCLIVDLSDFKRPRKPSARLVEAGAASAALRASGAGRRPPVLRQVPPPSVAAVAAPLHPPPAPRCPRRCCCPPATRRAELGGSCGCCAARATCPGRQSGFRCVTERASRSARRWLFGSPFGLLRRRRRRGRRRGGWRERGAWWCRQATAGGATDTFTRCRSDSSCSFESAEEGNL